MAKARDRRAGDSCWIWRNCVPISGWRALPSPK